MILNVKPDINETLDPLPANVLLDVARNESASYEWRKAAVRIMRKKGYKQAGHPELALFAREIEKEEQAESEVIAVVESAIEGPLDGDDHGATE